jgi:glycosyltransferase involved in cell wall biosynthesis
VSREISGAAPLRATIAIDHPAQHFAAAFQMLAVDASIDLDVLYWRDITGGYHDRSFGRDVTWDIDLVSGHPHHTAAATTAVGRACEIVGRLRKHRPQVILCYGWATPVARVALAFAASTRTPVVIYGDATWQHSSRPRLQPIRKVLLRRLFSRRFVHALSTGAFNREFYLIHGLNPERVYDGVCPVDVRPFTAAADRATRSKGARRVIGFAGKLVERKAPADVIEAAALLDDRSSIEVRLIGEGPLRPDLEQLVGKLTMTETVRFDGFLNASAMPVALADVDVLVVPSTRDMRVLVATEAMAAGAVPVVSSATAVWGAGDLVQHGVTGFVYPAGDIGCLAATLQRLVDDEQLRATISAAAMRRAQDDSAAAFATLASRALRRAVGGANGLERESLPSSR